MTDPESRAREMLAKHAKCSPYGIGVTVKRAYPLGAVTAALTLADQQREAVEKERNACASNYAAAARELFAAEAALGRMREAAVALRDDMLMRAEMNKHQHDGEIVVEAGNGVWKRFNAALADHPAPTDPDVWMPIETAPHNKTMVALLWVSQDGKERMYGIGWYMPLEGWQVWKGPVHAPYAGPTHWTPLPPPPEPRS